MSTPEPRRIATIGELHQLLNLPHPEHPLISVVALDDVQRGAAQLSASYLLDFYLISLKRNAADVFSYGQQHYAGQGGILYFMAPGQVFGPADLGETVHLAGWALYLHPDFLWNTPLAKDIKKYLYFTYSVHEALQLSGKEETTVIGLLQAIRTEYFANTDAFSQNIIIALLGTLFHYADRFYHRQFLARKVETHHLLTRLEALLSHYFATADLATQGLPSVVAIARELAISPNYLSSLLRAVTGRTTQQHIQDKMIEQAKEKIAASQLSVSEISYALGFEHPQSFSRLFKARTGLSPAAFRQALN